MNGNAFAYDFMVNGIAYNVLSSDDKTVEVVYDNPDESAYRGDIVLPETVTDNGATYTVVSIGERAFKECRNLKSVGLPSSIWKIGYEAFSSCSGLGSVDLPTGVTEIGEMAFYGCSGLSSIKIPEGVATINQYTFSDCKKLAAIELPSSLASIDYGAFEGCAALANVTIPSGVSEIEPAAFARCTSLTDITVADGNTGYLSKDGVLFGKKLLDDGVSYDRLRLVCYPAGKTATSYSLPDIVDDIWSESFAGCQSLTSVEMGEKVEFIGELAFDGCDGMRKVYCKAMVPPECEYGNAFPDAVYNEATLYVPVGKSSDYKAATYTWGQFKNIEEIDFGGVDNIRDAAVGVVATAGRIEVNGVEVGTPIKVYSAMGRLLYDGTSVSISIPTRGIYMVYVAGQVFKVAL